jgi:TatA/E family protein of Tat protein translocase
MGSLGVPEMMLIFVLALVLFGPKKLPEIGRTLGKAITEFRRASTELKSTFEKEMQTQSRKRNRSNRKWPAVIAASLTTTTIRPMIPRSMGPLPK